MASDAAGAPALRLALFYIAYFIVVGIALPFWPVWLQARGADAAEIGVLLSAGLWVRIVASPLVARLADRRGETRRPLQLLSAGAFAGYVLFQPAQGFVALLLVSIFSSFCFAAMLPLADSLAIQAARARAIDYGRVRLWGSLAFIAAAAFGGWLLAGRPAGLVLPLLLGGLALTFGACLLLPDLRRPAAAPGQAGALRLLADRRFLLLLAASGLIQASHAVLYGFGSLHWQAAGHTKDVIGGLWAEGVVAEILLFAVGSAVLHRIGGARLLVIGGIAAVLRWCLAGAGTGLPLLLLVQLLHGLSFGATHLAAMDFLARSAPPDLAATAQSLHAAVAVGIVMGVAMLAAGALYEALAGGAFLAMAGVALVGTIAALALAALRPPAQQAGLTGGRA